MTAAIHNAHDGEVDAGGIKQIAAVRRLSVARGWNTAVELSLYACCAKLDGLFEHSRSSCVFVISVERSRVVLNQRVDLRGDAVIETVKSAAVDICLDELGQIIVVLREISLVFQKCHEELPVRKIDTGRKRRINREVDRLRGTAGLKTAKGQIIVPRDDIEPAVVLVQVVVMRHRAAQAVQIDDKGLDCHVAQDIIDVHGFCQRFGICVIGADIFERVDDAAVVFICALEYGAFPNALVAGKLIVDIIQRGSAVAAKAAARWIAVAWAALTAGISVCIAIGVAIGVAARDFGWWIIDAIKAAARWIAVSWSALIAGIFVCIAIGVAARDFGWWIIHAIKPAALVAALIAGIFREAIGGVRRRARRIF